MIAVIDTNVLISGLVSPSGCPAKIALAWASGDFFLATSEQQLQEIRDTSKKPYFTQRVRPHTFGHLINSVRSARIFLNVERRHTALDPTDSFLLDLAVAASADYLITGDKRSGLLQQARVGKTHILTPSGFCTSVLKLTL